MEYWAEKAIIGRDLLPICGEALSRAGDGKSKDCEQFLREALSGEILRRSILLLEKKRILREMRAAAAESGNESAVFVLDGAIKRIEED